MCPRVTARWHRWGHCALLVLELALLACCFWTQPGAGRVPCDTDGTVLHSARSQSPCITPAYEHFTHVHSESETVDAWTYPRHVCKCICLMLPDATERCVFQSRTRNTLQAEGFVAGCSHGGMLMTRPLLRLSTPTRLRPSLQVPITSARAKHRSRDGGGEREGQGQREGAQGSGDRYLLDSRSLTAHYDPCRGLWAGGQTPLIAPC